MFLFINKINKPIKRYISTYKYPFNGVFLNKCSTSKLLRIYKYSRIGYVLLNISK